MKGISVKGINKRNISERKNWVKDSFHAYEFVHMIPLSKFKKNTDHSSQMTTENSHPWIGLEIQQTIFPLIF